MADHSAAAVPSLADVLPLVLARAECSWSADTYTGRAPLPGDDEGAASQGGEQADVPAHELALRAALCKAAARGAPARMAGALACLNRGCRDAANAFAAPAARAARDAQARAVHDIMRALRECCDIDLKPRAARGLVPWCLADATSALAPHYPNAPDAAAAWRAFGEEVTDAATAPRRILSAGARLFAKCAKAVARMRLSDPAPEVSDDDDEDDPYGSHGDIAAWDARLLQLLERAPGA